MNVVIIEDEKPAADKLELMLTDIDPKIQVLAKLGSVKESTKWLLQNEVELIFLDIQLSDGISFSIFDHVSVSTPIIFTTAYNQYAVKAFNLNSIDYLLKPIRKKDLAKSLQKFHDLKSAFSIDFDELLNQIQGEHPKHKKRFLIQIGNKIKKIEVTEIAYFYVMNKAVYIRTFNNKNYPLDDSLEHLENAINPELFFRINRKYLVNIEAIENMVAYSRGRVKLELKPKVDNEFETIVSINRSVEFKKWLSQ